MKPPSAIERWGPLAISLMCLLALIATTWSSGERAARSEGRAEGLQQQINQRNQIEVALRAEVETWKAYVVVLRGEMIKAGVQAVPPPPQPSGGEN